MPGNNRINFGRYKGELLDDASRHSITLRGPAVAATDRPVDRLVVDYFYHRGEYRTAAFPLDGVDEIRGQAFNFSPVKTRQGANGPETIRDEFGVPKRRFPMLNHLQSRFRMRPGHSVDLYPLHGAPQGAPLEQVNDFIYSIEAVGPQGVGFGLRDGFQGSLISAHRFLSTEEMVFERIAVEGQYVLESPPLPLNAKDKRALLIASLERSHRAGMTEPYYLYRCCGTNNCTSNPLQLLDETVDYSWRQRMGALLYRLPFHPRYYLRVRGMDTDPGYRKLVRSEFVDFISSPEIQQRKRAYVRTRVRRLREARASRSEQASP